mmetsp:Transcript_97421/g.225859  ORF Transcript_97421/g.225859 Transcript_97421/m.225859 type:complete len:217 (+) Transcript_97421:137-787(+)
MHMLGLPITVLPWHVTLLSDHLAPSLRAIVGVVLCKPLLAGLQRSPLVPLLALASPVRDTKLGVAVQMLFSTSLAVLLYFAPVHVLPPCIILVPVFGFGLLGRFLRCAVCAYLFTIFLCRTSSSLAFSGAQPLLLYRASDLYRVRCHALCWFAAAVDTAAAAAASDASAAAARGVASGMAAATAAAAGGTCCTFLSLLGSLYLNPRFLSTRLRCHA